MFVRLKRYFFWDFEGRFLACFLAFLDVGGGGLAISRLTASSKLIPRNLRSSAFGISVRAKLFL